MTMQHFDFDTPINRLGTYCTQWDYVQDRFGKADLIPFTISDMDFAAPPAIIKALEERIAHPVFGYSRWNHADYKNAIAHWYQTRFQCDVNPEHLVYGPSVIYIVSKLIQLWSKPNEGVITQTPAYDAFDKMILGAKRKSVHCPLLKTEQGWEINWQAFEDCLSAPENKIFLLCSPHNPTGRIWTNAELTRIATLCQQHSVKVISDEIHMDVAYQPHLPYFAAEQTDQWALVTSTSKTFNVPALNGAYAFIPDSMWRDTYLHQLKEVDGLSSPSILAVIATMSAYRDCAPWLDALTTYVLANHQRVADILNTAFPTIQYKIPDATYLAWIDLRSLHLNMQKLQRDLIDIYHVAIMDGEVYGEAGKGFVRLNLGCAQSKVDTGLNALLGAIKNQTES